MPFKLLIVEDTPDSRNLLHFLFTTKGFTVSTACDATEGLYLMKAEKPDLIITDLLMPDIDGIEMIRQVRAEPEFASIPIAIYTAHTLNTTEEPIEEENVKIFFKPFDLDALIEYVNDMAKQANDQ